MMENRKQYPKSEICSSLCPCKGGSCVHMSKDIAYFCKYFIGGPVDAKK